MKYHYTECGLNNVFIEGIEPMIDDDGDEVIQIPFINALHTSIALGIISHENSMSGAELRYLRSEMGLTQSELATLIHVDRQTIGRWERGETVLDGSPEIVVRQLSIEKLLLPFREGIEKLAQSSVESAEQQMINVVLTDTGYDLAA